MDISKAIAISASGLDTHPARLRVIAEDLAKQDSAGSSSSSVRVRNVGVDRNNLPRRYDVRDPSADSNGYVHAPNVKSSEEIMEIRQAQRGYRVNLSVMKVTRAILTRTIELLK